MGETDSRGIDGGFQLDERERKFAERVKDMLLKHIEHRLPLKVWTAEVPAEVGWMWALGRDYFKPWKAGSWIDSVYYHNDGRVFIYWGASDVSDAISEEHPRVYDRLVKEGGDPEKNVEELFRVVEDLQFRENWKKYERVIPKVVRFFRKCERVAREVSREHEAQVEFWINDQRWGIRAIVDTEDMDEDEKLKAIMKASAALKDFDKRL